ncbi:hypothetical protein [Streptomyces cacaoi]|uniref:hypothetical protein n=1 Tax=Streptomyces cacaoi TaxID=1898 RepID=UPI00263796E3|nr:hypothetical protein [Streptomyces cacaoi]
MPASSLLVSVHGPGDATALWAEAKVTDLLDGAPDGITVPSYGSPAWLALPAGHPLRSAAVVTAAEAWRRRELEAQRLDALAETDPEAWFREMTAEADRHAARLGPRLAAVPTVAELARHRRPCVPRRVAAAPGWPVRVPGRPDTWRHYIDGRQVDLPACTAPRARRAAA